MQRGMSDKLGPLTFGKKEEHIFLGKELSSARDYSEQTAQDIDNEIKKIVLDAQEQATRLLRENIDKLHALAKELLEKESLDGEQIDAILRGSDTAEKIIESQN
jgi:cell division protease FtsH